MAACRSPRLQLGTAHIAAVSCTALPPLQQGTDQEQGDDGTCSQPDG